MFLCQRSNVTISWFSSLNSSQSDVNSYIPIIQQTINDSCPTSSCSLNPAVARVLRIDWKNLLYRPLNSNTSTVNNSLVIEFI